MCSTDRHTLLADSIRLAFGTFNVLNGAWLRSETGKVTGVLGRNGSGKSCMFKAIMGGLRTQELFVRIDDEILTGSMEMGKHVKYMAQMSFLPPKMTMKEIFDCFEADYDAFCNDFPKFLIYPDTPAGELSGGEIRIAEIWLCLCSPSPFCILDEIEAALDDANIGYYADYLREYSRGTQFIVVTHRKGTMERCNSLFGVAMEEQGVSKMVSVSLQDYKE